MAKKPVILDSDGLPASEVGEWAPEKHARVERYIEIAAAPRAGYIPPPAWRGGAAYIELYCGPGRSQIRETGCFVDGSPLIAYKAAAATVPFTQMHLNDFDPDYAAAVDARLRALGARPTCYSEPAESAVDKIVAAVNPSGLHFAFLDPFNLNDLPFDIIRKLAKLKRVDMLIHVSVHDLQRNIDEYSRPGSVLDRFAPGWRNHVDPKQSINAFRAALMEYWLSEIRKLGTMPAKGMPLIVGSKQQRLYWLVFVGAHDLAQKLWDAIRDPMKQTRMDF